MHCTLHKGSSTSFAADFRPVDLVVRAPVDAADTGAAAGDPDQLVDEGGAVDAMHGDRHVGEAGPRVGPRIVVVVVGEHAARSLAAPDMEASAGHHAVHAAA